MSPEVYEHVKVGLKALAGQEMSIELSVCLKFVIDQLPPEQRAPVLNSVLDAIDDQVQRYQPLMLKDIHPAESDLVLDLFRDSFAELAQKVREKLQPVN